jgi:Holliday junction resolvasome RuvABC endonuclease subunit
MKPVLGLDPGTQTGWAVCLEQDCIIVSGVELFAAVADQGYGAMFAALRRFLADLRRAQGPFAGIAYELPFLRGPIASRILWGMAAHVQERCAMWRCRPLPVNTMTLKKFATGSGKVGKEEMIKAAAAFAPRMIGLERSYVLGEHEADAIHVARWGWAQLQKDAGVQPSFGCDPTRVSEPQFERDPSN